MNDTCVCPVPWSRLYAVIEDERYEVEPAATVGPISALFRAWCADCGAEYTHPFRLVTAHPNKDHA